MTMGGNLFGYKFENKILIDSENLVVIGIGIWT